MTSVIPAKKWYVYYHIQNGEIFYIGSGKNGRALDVTNRNERWLKLTESPYDIKIEHFFDTEKDARSFEVLEINRIRPKANIRMAMTSREKQAKFRSTEHGRKYLNQFMKERRAFYKKAYDEGLIAYEKIPKSYRYFVKRVNKKV